MTPAGLGLYLDRPARVVFGDTVSLYLSLFPSGVAFRNHIANINMGARHLNQRFRIAGVDLEYPLQLPDRFARFELPIEAIGVLEPARNIDIAFAAARCRFLNSANFGAIEFHRRRKNKR